MKVTSQPMDNSIFKLQNQEFLLKLQLTQRNQYSKAKKIDLCKLALTLGFTLLSGIASFLEHQTLSSICGLLSILLLILNKSLDARISSLKKNAASLQQYIDVELFSSVMGGNKLEWGELPNRTDLVTAISQVNIFDLSSVKDWYSNYTSLSGESQVFHCQRENVRWDYQLHKSYKTLVLCVFTVLAITMFAVIVCKDLTSTKFIFVISCLAPLSDYAYTAHKQILESISLLQTIEASCNQIESKLLNNSTTSIKKELIDLQYSILKRRATCFLIPDWFYKFKKEQYQKQEDCIAESIVDLHKESNSQH